MTDELNLPPSSDKAWLLVKSPAAVFVCWTLGRAKTEAFKTASYAPNVLVRLVSCEDKTLAVEAEVRWDAGKIYLKPPAEGRICSAAVYARKKDGGQEKLLESNAVAAPVSSPLGGVSSGYSSAEFFRRLG
ncbi:MAG: DUF4912 domain-containing protein [Elusimicrobia bacterium]|nr:DUF4912 domain-containing protein [Elusimicrobiota bacterium]